MIRCCVVADDLTGANATAVLLRKTGLHTCTVLQPERLTDEHRERYDTVVIPTDSRGLSSEQAYEIVNSTVKKLISEPIELYNKRIDSTLRGNVGSEIDAMLDALDEPRVAVVVPVFPQAGRVAVGDYLLVNGVALERTDAARDPKMPVGSSRVTDIVSHQTRYPVHHIGLGTVYQGRTAIAETLRAIGDATRAIVVLDALTDSDLDVIASGVLDSAIRFVSVDPGPFTAAVARQLVVPADSENRGAEVLMCVGSVTSLTVEQLRHTFDNLDVSWAFLRAERVIGDDEERAEEVRRVTDTLLSKATSSRVLCVSTNRLDISQTLDLEQEAKKRGGTSEELSNSINRSIAEVAEELFGQLPNLRGLYASGGDITVALCHASEAEGIEVQHEVMPLAAQGRMVGGHHEGLRVVSKGGMVGGTDAATLCVQSLLEALEQAPEFK